MTPAAARRLPLPLFFEKTKKSSDSQHFVHCPAHEDKRPSCSLRRKKGEWKWRCFSCGAAGDAVDLVMLREQCGYKKALEWIADKFGDVEYDTAPEPSDPYVLVCAAPGCGATRDIGPRDYRTPGYAGREWRSSSELEALMSPDWEVAPDLVAALCPRCAWKFESPSAETPKAPPAIDTISPDFILPA